MLGWEFPPFISGGLGVACYGLTRAMSGAGTEVLFVLPRSVPGSHSSHVQLLTPESPGQQPEPSDPLRQEAEAGESEQVRFFPVPSPLRPYQRPPGQSDATLLGARHGADRVNGGPGDDYGGDLFAEVRHYRQLVSRLALSQNFDVIHAHDWMTYPAGMRVARLTGKPLVVHVHSTEFDRAGEQVNPFIYRIEQAGMQQARAVITVSYLTRTVVTEKYGIAPEKVHVVYNALDLNGSASRPGFSSLHKKDKVVLFLGRITTQKGPSFFVAAAERILRRRSDVRFIMAGSGDLLGRTMMQARQLGVGDRVVFPGFLRGRDVDRMYRMADVYVMPSVSEPFGLVALEAISHGVPTIVSKQSGVAEVLDSVLKVDHWDVQAMADLIGSVLEKPELRTWLRHNGHFDLAKLSWGDAARRCVDVYRAVAK